MTGSKYLADNSLARIASLLQVNPDKLARLLSRTPSEAHALLYLLDCFAVVELDKKGDRLLLTVREKSEAWREALQEIVRACDPYKGEILELVREREKRACLHCSHWHPLDDSFGLCELMPGICGRLYGCERFGPKKNYTSREGI